MNAAAGAAAEGRDLFTVAEQAAGGLKLGPVQWIRFEAVRRRLGAEGIAADDDRIPRWLAAAVCRSPSERREFLAVFEGASRPPPAGPLPDHGKDETAARLFDRAGRRNRLLLSGSAALVLVVMVLLLLLLPRPRPEQVAPPPPPPSRAYLETLQTTRPRLTDQATPDWLAILMLLPPPAAAGLFYLWYRRRQRRLRRDFSPAPDISSRLAFRDDRTRLFNSRALRSELRRLRRHRRQPGTALDVRASILATIKACGRPEPRFLQRRLTPDYVLLYERSSPRDHLSYVGASLAERIRGESVPLETYMFAGKPDPLREPRSRRDQPLATVLANHPDARAMLFGEGFTLRRDPATPAWAARLTGAGLIAHLDPAPPQFWDRGEALLEQDGIPSYPLSRRGLATIAASLADPEAPRAPAVPYDQLHAFDLPESLGRRRRALLTDVPPDPVLIAGLVADLSAWLGVDAARWLAATALFPYLDPGLTAWLGARLQDGAGAPMLTDERFLALARLPWMRAGRMPDWLRLALVRRLDPETQAAATAAIQAYLLPADEEEDRGAAIEIGRGRDPALRRKLLAWLVASPESEYHDRILLDTIRGRPADCLGFEPSTTFRRRLERWWKDPAARAVAAVAALLLLILLVRPPVTTVGRNLGETEQVTTERIPRVVGADDPGILNSASEENALADANMASGAAERSDGTSSSGTDTAAANTAGDAGNTVIPDADPVTLPRVLSLDQSEIPTQILVDLLREASSDTDGMNRYDVLLAVYLGNDLRESGMNSDRILRSIQSQLRGLIAANNAMRGRVSVSSEPPLSGEAQDNVSATCLSGCAVYSIVTHIAPDQRTISRAMRNNAGN